MRTDREWIELTLSHAGSGPLPFNFSFTPPARRLVGDHYGLAESTPSGRHGSDFEDALGLPIRMTSPRSVKPLYADPGEFGDAVTDEFGVVWSTSAVDRGVPVGPCLREPSLAGHVFPEAQAECRFDDLGEWCSAREGHYRIIWIGDLWERATFMRGMEGLLLDVALRPAFVSELLGELADFILRTMTVLFERFEFEAVALSDDYGTQHGLIISPDDWRKLVKPHLAEIYAFAKAHGRAVFHHSCGDIVPIIGDMIDVGLDILHPIQPEAMDISFLKREFGHLVTLCGGIPTQNLLVFGGPDQVREEVRRLKREMGAGGGYILEPGIAIQADVPLENMVAMIEEARTPAT